jgi:hypothetical protein
MTSFTSSSSSSSDGTNAILLGIDDKLLDEIRNAISHMSREDNFHGVDVELDVVGRDDAAASAVSRKWRVPGPMACAGLLESMGMPPPPLISSSTSPSSSAPETHASYYYGIRNSQIDRILDCCLDAAISLSRSCEPGRYSLIGTDFDNCGIGGGGGDGGGVKRHHHRHHDDGAGGDRRKKSAAHLVEEIWRFVWNVRIVYDNDDASLSCVGASGTMGGPRTHVAASSPSSSSPPLYAANGRIRIGRIGSIGGAIDEVDEAVIEFLSAGRGGNDIPPHDDDAENTASTWNAKDRRRYDKAVVIFNAALASYAKLSSSASGIRSEVRRDMVQSAERLLLEVMGRRSGSMDGPALPPSPSTILTCVQPDVISFNTAMRAWSEFSPKQQRTRRGTSSSFDECDDDRIGRVGTATATAERTEGILALMQELWDDERAARTTSTSVRAAWEGRRWIGGDDGRADRRGGRHDPIIPGHGAIAPNSSSYNSVLKAWSRCSDPNASLRALAVYRSMISRANVASSARDSLVRGGTTSDGVGNAAIPDSRTFVLLLQSLRNLPASIGFRNALDAIECIIDSTKRWDEQIQWSVENNLLPSTPGGELSQANRPLRNVFSYNTLIKTLSQIPSSWEESRECCLRIDDIVEGMDSGASSVRANAITAWKKCAEHAGEDKERLRLCAKKSGLHVDVFMDSMRSTTGNNTHEGLLIQAISDAISLYGRAGMPSKADELFRRAKSHNAHNLGTLSTVIDALCENGLEDIAHVDRAKQYLLDFEAEKMKMSRFLVSPDMKYTKMYNAVIAGYLGCDTKKRGLEQADALLEHMISSHESNPRHIARPNTTSFARLMSALSQRGDNTRRLEGLLKKMETLNHRRKSVLKSSKDAELVANVVPNIVCYNTLLKAFARSSDEEALQSAMKLLGRMEADPDIQPDDTSNSYILALLSRKNDADVGEAASSGETVKYVSHALTNLDMDSLPFDDLNLNGRNDPTSKSFNSIMNGEFCVCVNANDVNYTQAILT